MASRFILELFSRFTLTAFPSTRWSWSPTACRWLPPDVVRPCQPSRRRTVPSPAEPSESSSTIIRSIRISPDNKKSKFKINYLSKNSVGLKFRYKSINNLAQKLFSGYCLQSLFDYSYLKKRIKFFLSCNQNSEQCFTQSLFYEMSFLNSKYYENLIIPVNFMHQQMLNL